MADIPPPAATRSMLGRLLDGIERSGNRLPDPVYIFMVLCLIILLASWACGLAGVSAINPATGKTVVVDNLLDREGLVRIVREAINNFSAFPPLGVVLATMIGVGVAEKSGWFEAMMRATVARAPRAFIIPVIILIGILGNMAGDAAIVVLPPIAAVVFIRLGYHPIAGLAVAYATTEGGFAANLLVGITDVLALSFTAPAAALIDDTVPLNAAMNYYFIAVSTLLLLGVAWWVTMRIVIPRLGHWTPSGADHGMDEVREAVTAAERRGMRAANIALALMTVLLLALSLPEGAPLRNPETGLLLDDSPLMEGIILIVTVFFLVPGVVYAWGAGTARNGNDIARWMGESMASMGGYIVIIFFAAQMLAFFKWSNLGTVLAIKGASALADQSGVTLIVGIVLLTAIINLLIGSSSAKWAVLAPIFVPMMMLLDFHPAFTQMVYRVGDSLTNPVTPMEPYIVLVLAYAQRYVPGFRLGSLIATLLPYTVAFAISWTALLVLWYLLGWPVGPGGPIHLGH